MDERHIEWIRLVAGLVAIAAGLIWALQGIGLLPGKLMSGHPIWLVIGVALMLVGALLVRAGIGARS